MFTLKSGKPNKNKTEYTNKICKFIKKSHFLSCGLFIFLVELYYDRGNHHEFVSLVKDLARPGEMAQSQTFDFEFTHVEKPYESYTGQNVKLRYVFLSLCSSVKIVYKLCLNNMLYIYLIDF